MDQVARAKSTTFKTGPNELTAPTTQTRHARDFLPFDIGGQSVTKFRAKHLLNGSTIPRESLPCIHPSETADKGRISPSARLGSHVRIVTEEKGWDFLKRL